MSCTSMYKLSNIVQTMLFSFRSVSVCRHGIVLVLDFQVGRFSSPNMLSFLIIATTSKHFHLLIPKFKHFRLASLTRVYDRTVQASV